MADGAMAKHYLEAFTLLLFIIVLLLFQISKVYIIHTIYKNCYDKFKTEIFRGLINFKLTNFDDLFVLFDENGNEKYNNFDYNNIYKTY